MMRQYRAWSIFILFVFGMGLLGGVGALAAEKPSGDGNAFPRSLDSYNDSEFESIIAILKNRIKLEPFNLVATLIFLCVRPSRTSWLSSRGNP